MRIPVLLLLCSLARAQAPADPQTLQSLLSEVHQLRIAMERSAAITPRIQIVVERLKLQQEQVARTSRELTDLRRDLERGRMELGQNQARIQSLENAESQETDTAKRREL